MYEIVIGEEFEFGEIKRDKLGVFGRLLRMCESKYQVIERYVGSYRMPHLIFTEPHDKSYAAFLMLKEQYMKADTAMSEKYDWKKWVVFRHRYLTEAKRKNGVLVCQYCGRADLHISSGKAKRKGMSSLATIDHIKPLSKGGEKYNKKNMVIVCFKCNHEKGDEDYTMRVMRKRNYIKYIIINIYQKLCIFLKFLSRF